MHCFVRVRQLAILALLLSWSVPTCLSAAEMERSNGTSKHDSDKPNFVWLISEDNSTHYMKLYAAEGAATPRIEALAKHGLIFDHAFSNAPVCSVARTTLITGCYAPRIGTQYHRRSVLAPMPNGLRMFPAYLREAGYYTTNNQKTDYNAVAGKGVWDESSRKASWRGRQPGQPFFHKQSFKVTHESSLHFRNTRRPTKHSADTQSVAPYHPDTPVFRYTNARYRDNIQAMDGQIGQVVDQLKQDGLLENTFIFYFGDHGGVLPRSKGYAYDSGLHVPLVVRVPERWKHLVADMPLGSRQAGFVSFIDFGPTLLHLASLSVPEQMDGRAFLGANISAAELSKRDEAFGYADRFDEKIDHVRTLRVGRFEYIRNYQPFNFDGLQNNYRYKSLAYQQWRQLYQDGKLSAEQRQFFEPRPAEMLFDLDADPHETQNLANDPRHVATLASMRARLQQQVKQLPDLSMYPESHLVDHAIANPVEFGIQHQREIAELVDIADLSLLPWQQARDGIRDALGSADRWHRYWALIACSSFGKQASEFVGTAKKLAQQDEENLVRVRAAEFLGLIGVEAPGPVLERCLMAARHGVEANQILNTAVLLRDGPHRYPFHVEASYSKPTPGMAEVKRRLIYLAD